MHRSGNRASELATEAELGATHNLDELSVEEVLALIGEASGNLVLKMARRAINPLFDERFRETRRRFRPPEERVHKMVAEIDQAIALRDADGAERALRSFLRAGRSQALEFLSSYSSVGQPDADIQGDPNE